MNKLVLAHLFLVATLATQAQFIYHDAAQFPLIGKISAETETRYERLPTALKEKARKPVWDLGKNTSGLAVRFRTNSSAIAAKWEVLSNVSMNHMTDTDIKGLDLYVWHNGQWRSVNSAKPSGKHTTRVIVTNMPTEEREYLLYLPLYDGVVDLFIGIDENATIEQPKEMILNRQNPIVYYGTSITQGGCATRPGMSYTNILERKLNREVINLGFNGNAHLDEEIAHLLSTRQDAGLYVLDFLPNVDDTRIRERLATFVRILREGNKHTPLLFVESIIYPHATFDQQTQQALDAKNKALHEEFEKLQSAGYKNIHLVSAKDFLGNDGEATVDGVHFTDLGFLRYAEGIESTIKALLN